VFSGIRRAELICVSIVFSIGFPALGSENVASFACGNCGSSWIVCRKLVRGAQRRKSRPFVLLLLHLQLSAGSTVHRGFQQVFADSLRISNKGILIESVSIRV